MTSSDATDPRRRVENRRAEIAGHWFRAVARTSFTVQSAADVRQAFDTLTGQIIDLLFAERFERQHAQAIGATLADLAYAQPEALGRTYEILTQQLLAGVAPPQRLVLHTRLAFLLGEVAIGFTRQIRATVLTEQEQLHTALIEQRKRVEAALRASEQRLRLVITNAPIVLFALDCAGVITLAEGKGLDALGLTPDAVAGQSILDLRHITPQIIENIQRALAGEAFTDIVEIDAVVFETRYAPLRDERDQVVGMIGVAVDITERTRLQAELEGLRSNLTPSIPSPLSDDDSATALTRREWDVIRLIVAGKTNQEMALALSISIKTVEKHISSVYAKLGVHSRVDVAKWALHRADTTPPDSPQR